MIEPLVELLVLVVVAIVVYALIRWRLILATQDIRIRTALAADDLLDDPRLSPRAKQRLIFHIQSAFNGWAPWLILVGLVFGAVLSLALPRALARLSTDDHEISDDQQVVSKYRKVIRGFGLSYLALSPLAAFLVVNVLAIALVLLASTEAIGRLVAVTSERFPANDILSHRH